MTVAETQGCLARARAVFARARATTHSSGFAVSLGRAIFQSGSRLVEPCLRGHRPARAALTSLILGSVAVDAYWLARGHENERLQAASGFASILETRQQEHLSTAQEERLRSAFTEASAVRSRLRSLGDRPELRALEAVGTKLGRTVFVVDSSTFGIFHRARLGADEPASLNSVYSSASAHLVSEDGRRLYCLVYAGGRSRDDADKTLDDPELALRVIVAGHELGHCFDDNVPSIDVLPHRPGREWLLSQAYRAYLSEARADALGVAVADTEARREGSSALATTQRMTNLIWLWRLSSWRAADYHLTADSVKAAEVRFSLPVPTPSANPSREALADELVRSTMRAPGMSGLMSRDDFVASFEAISASQNAISPYIYEVQHGLTSQFEAQRQRWLLQSEAAAATLHNAGVVHELRPTAEDITRFNGFEAHDGLELR